MKLVNILLALILISLINAIATLKMGSTLSDYMEMLANTSVIEVSCWAAVSVTFEYLLSSKLKYKNEIKEVGKDNCMPAINTAYKLSKIYFLSAISLLVVLYI